MDHRYNNDSCLNDSFRPIMYHTILLCSVPGYMMRTVGCSGMPSILHADIDRWECGRLCLASPNCDVFIYNDSPEKCFLVEGICHDSATASNVDSYTKSK